MEKKAHHYTLTLEHLANKTVSESPTPETPDKALTLNFTNHDDLFAILDKIKSRELFDEQTSTEFVLGLKLLGEVVIRNRNHPLFSEFKDDFSSFMKKLKEG